MGTKLYKKPEWVVNMEEMQEKLKGNRKAMSNDSLEHDDCVACEDEDRSSEYDSCCEEISREEAEEEEDDYDSIPYKHDSFYLLPPIEEKSEPSSSDHDKSSDIGKRSLSLSELSRSESANFEYRSMTFPRSKTTEEAYAKEMGDTCSQQQTLHRTLYPLEPRELDPESFHQLHTADSSEELQEFLLLESQCMDSDGGLAAAFLEQPSGDFRLTLLNDLRFCITSTINVGLYSLFVSNSWNYWLSILLRHSAMCIQSRSIHLFYGFLPAILGQPSSSEFAFFHNNSQWAYYLTNFTSCKQPVIFGQSNFPFLNSHDPYKCGYYQNLDLPQVLPIFLNDANGKQSFPWVFFNILANLLWIFGFVPESCTQASVRLPLAHA